MGRLCEELERENCSRSREQVQRPGQSLERAFRV